MNTSYYSKGYFVRNRHKILKRYVKENFILDFITILPFLIGNKLNNLQFVEVAFLMRIVKLKQISKKLEDFMLLREKAMAFVRMIKLAFLLIFVANICGCVFHYVAIIEKNFGVNNTWLDYKGITNEHWSIRFINSLYWAIVTMITVGYGDISPQTSAEKIVAIIIIILSCGVFGYSINAVGRIIEDLSIKESEFYTKISSFSYFMQRRKISRELQAEIKRYLEYTRDEEITYSQNISHSFSTALSSRLKNKFMMECYKSMIMKHKMFKNNFTADLIERLCLLAKEKSFAPDDVIFEEGENENLNMYFVLCGQIDIQVGPNKQLINTLGKDTGFGEFSFITGLSREFSAKSSCLTTVAYITQQDFQNCLKLNEKDFENFQLIKEKLKNELNIDNQYCEICQKNTDHITNKCTRITYKYEFVSHKKFKVSRFKPKNTSQRKPFLRTRPPMSTLMNYVVIKDSIRTIASQLYSEEEKVLDSDEDSEFSLKDEFNGLEVTQFERKNSIEKHLLPKTRRLSSNSNFPQSKRNMTMKSSNELNNYPLDSYASCNLNYGKIEEIDLLNDWKYYHPEYNPTRVLINLENERIKRLLRKNSVTKRNILKRGTILTKSQQSVPRTSLLHIEKADEDHQFLSNFSNFGREEIVNSNSSINQIINQSN